MPDEFTDDTATLVFEEGRTYETTFAWGLGYVISESDAYDPSLVDSSVNDEIVSSIFV